MTVVRDPDGNDRRLILPIKNNIGNDTTGMAYVVAARDIGLGQDVPFITWEKDPVEIDADEAMSNVNEDDRSMANECEEWLQDFLADGPKKAKEIYAAADRDGFSKKVLWKASKELDVYKEKDGFKLGWTWTLRQWATEDSPKIPEDYHFRNGEPSGIFETEGNLRNDDNWRIGEQEESQP